MSIRLLPSLGTVVVACLRAWPLLMLPAVALAAEPGLSTLGATGGLKIPSAYVLPAGTLALSAGDDPEPALGAFTWHRTMSLGIGLVPGLEFFGRVAEYQNKVAGSRFSRGVRDISANLKMQLPVPWRSGPSVAVGITDIGGGAVFFQSRYAVVSDDLGPVRWTLGYARGTPVLGDATRAAVFDGSFGGLEVGLPAPGASLLVERDGQAARAGIRYQSQALPSLANARVQATWQRSRGATGTGGLSADANSFSMALVIPTGSTPASEGQQARRSLTAPLPDIDLEDASVMPDVVLDRLQTLERQLAETGLERVRVGRLGSDLVVEYENNRYLQSEADAMGIVLGLGAELAPATFRRIYAVALRAGLPLYETSAGVAEFRRFLRGTGDDLARGTLAFDAPARYTRAAVDWVTSHPQEHRRIRFELKPVLVHTLATDVGLYDYALAINTQVVMPLWPGADLFASHVQPLANSLSFDPAGAFARYRPTPGWKSIGVYQTFWVGQSVLANVGVGRYRNGTLGVEGEATVRLPDTEDVLRLEGARYARRAGETRAQAMPLSAVYRKVFSHTTWLEGGVQQYSDGSRGPSVALTRWYGDVAMRLYFRQGAGRQFAGLELSLPLAPRRSVQTGSMSFGGSHEFNVGMRTRLARGGTSANLVQPNAVRDFEQDYSPEVRHLDRGRISQPYLLSELNRMRDAFYTFARPLLHR